MKSIPRIQIAGIKNLEEARICVEAGADGFGLLLMLDYPREDAVSTETAGRLAEYFHKNSNGTSVLITHSTDPEAISLAVLRTEVDAVQVHNDSANEISVENLWRIREALPAGTRLIKVLHVPESHEQVDGVVMRAKRFAGIADAVILDSKTVENIEGRDYVTLGGTGKPNNREFAREIVAAVDPFPVIYAGGLDPDSVAEAVRFVRPYGVDVNSGTRRSGSFEKDPDKVLKFVKNATAVLGPG